MFNRRVICLSLAVCSFFTNAEVITHYKARTFKAETVNVISPQLLELSAHLVAGSQQLSTVYIKTKGLIFDEGDKIPCEEVETANCIRLKAYLDLKDVRFRLGDHINKNAFYGQVFVEGENLRNTMIKDGWYKFDYKVGRSRYDMFLQKEAECMRKGMWKNVKVSLTDMRCQ